jgi:iron complex outermembrane receptor protein
MLSMAFSHPAHAEKRDFRIETPEMPAALLEFGRQASAQLLFEADAVSGRRARPVSGMYEPIDALRLMLEGTALRAEERAGGVLIISRDASRQLAAGHATDTPARSIAPNTQQRSHEAAVATPVVNAALGSVSPAGEFALEEVIVTGTAGGAAVRKLDASFAISTVSAKEISRIAPLSTADLLKVIPGVWVESSGGISGANILLRGFPGGGDAPFVTLQVDGVAIFPTNVSFLEDSTLLRLDETVGRLEALRGGPSPVVASGQPGLTANFLLKEGGEQRKGTLKYTASDYDLERIDGFLSGKLADDWYYMVGGYLSSSQGLRDAGFESEEGSQLTIKVTRVFDRGTLKAFHRDTDDHGTWYLPVNLRNPDSDAGYTQVGPANRRVQLDFSVPVPEGGTETHRESVDMAEGRGWDGAVSGASFEFDLGQGFSLAERAGFTRGSADTVGFVPNGAAVPLSSLQDINGNFLFDGGTGAVTGNPIAGRDTVQQFGAWVVRKDLEALVNEVSLTKRWAEPDQLTLGYYASSVSVDEIWNIGNTKWYVQRHNGELVSEIACDGRPQADVDSCDWDLDLQASGSSKVDALYLTGQFRPVRPVTIDAGIRTSRFTTRYEADIGTLDGRADALVDTTTSKNTYTAALNWSLSDSMGLFFRVNRGYLAPGFDTYRGFQTEFHDRGQDLFQKVSQYELGYKLSKDTFALYATYFRNKVDGFPLCVVGGIVPCVLQKNAAQGLEIDAKLQLSDRFAIDLNATLQRTLIRNGPNRGNEVARQPPYQVRLSPTYSWAITDSLAASIYASYSIIAERQSDETNLVTLEPFEKLDCGMVVGMDRLSLQVAIDNATDSRGLTEGDPRNPTAPNGRFILPRSIQLSIAYGF